MIGYFHYPQYDNDTAKTLSCQALPVKITVYYQQSYRAWLWPFGSDGYIGERYG